jgi:hypothetical protein
VREACNPFLGHPNDKVLREEMAARVQAVLDEQAREFGFGRVMRARVFHDDEGELYIAFSKEDQ